LVQWSLAIVMSFCQWLWRDMTMAKWRGILKILSCLKKSLTKA
jgi:hypothetical protein